jgi:hypothetical protein
MTCCDPDNPDRVSLPTERQLFWAPERAILALLDANLVLASRMLNTQHPVLDETDQPSLVPLLILTRSIIATADSLRLLVAGYHDVAERLTYLENNPVCQGVNNPQADPEDDNF